MLRDLAFDLPAAFFVAGFDVLAGNQREQANELLLGVVEIGTFDRSQDAECVVDESRDQLVAGDRVVPRACRLARAGVVVIADQLGAAAASGMAVRTRRIIDTNCVTVSCVATASSNNVESSARRCLFANTFVDAITSRTASKIRSGRSERRSRLRHCVNVVGWNPASVIDRPHATFQRRSVANAWVASRSDNPSSRGRPSR